jgi:hypothetical protein
MTKDDIIRMAREVDLPNNYRTGEINNLNPLERFANLVAAHEREACDQLCQEIDGGDNMFARAIRARSQS